MSTYSTMKYLCLMSLFLIAFDTQAQEFKRLNYLGGEIGFGHNSSENNYTVNTTPSRAITSNDKLNFINLSLFGGKYITESFAFGIKGSISSVVQTSHYEDFLEPFQVDIESKASNFSIGPEVRYRKNLLTKMDLVLILNGSYNELTEEVKTKSSGSFSDIDDSKDSYFGYSGSAGIQIRPIIHLLIDVQLLQILYNNYTTTDKIDRKNLSVYFLNGIALGFSLVW